MEHTFSWLNRKYDHAMKEQFDNSSSRILEGYKSLLLLVDSAFNKGKDFDKILPPSYEMALESLQENTKENAKFVSGQWWKQTTKNAKESFKE